MKKLIAGFTAFVTIGLVSTLGGCASKADVASSNLSTAADNFQIDRRVVFYNGITGDVMLEIDGFCSLGNADPAKELSVTCKDDNGKYEKHFLGLSDNVTYFVEQLQPADVSVNHYKIIWRPSTLVPGIEIQ